MISHHPESVALGLIDLQGRARVAADTTLSEHAEHTDRTAEWPKASLDAVAKLGLMGLHVPVTCGGHGQGLLALTVVTEELAKGCSSTAMCYGMHCVATKVIAARATEEQETLFLRPIAQGVHITSLALSESGTGAHFFLPRVTYARADDSYSINGRKSFVTSGGHADSYVVSAVLPGAELDPGSFTCLVVPQGSPGMDWREGWDGFGMRGNGSCPLSLNDAQVAPSGLLGAEGDQIWFVFEVVAPYFLMAMAGVYIGIAQAALDMAIAHLNTRSHSHTGELLRDQAVLRDDIARAWSEVTATRQLIRHAAEQGDRGAADATPLMFAAKAKVAETAVFVTDIAMGLLGGRGYVTDSKLARLHRDARAAHVMSPTSHMLRDWLGRSLLGMPLL